jgi:TetR/AcrR family transcriptional regulator, cholesterol catabolism regulator
VVPQPTRPRNQRARRQAGADAAPPKRRDREVLDAAAKVFYENGYANSSVDEVAKELGILKGSLYHYIKTKEDLLFRLLAETHDDVDAILEAVEAVEGLSPLERLHLYVRRQVEYNIDALERVSVYYQDVDRLSAQRRHEIFARRHVHERFVADLIKQAQEAGEADAAQDPRLLAPNIFATMIWVYRWYRPGRYKRDQVAETCADFALRGVVGRPAG